MSKRHWSERVKEGIKGSIDLITRYPGILGFTAGTATAVFTGSATMAAAASVASPTAAVAVGGVTAVLTGYGAAAPVMRKSEEWQKVRDFEKNGPREIPVGGYQRAQEAVRQSRIRTSDVTHARAEAVHARMHDLHGDANDLQSLNRAFSKVLVGDDDSPKGPSQS